MRPSFLLTWEASLGRDAPDRSLIPIKDRRVKAAERLAEKQTAVRLHKTGMVVRCMICHKQTAFLVEITAPEGENLQIY